MPTIANPRPDRIYYDSTFYIDAEFADPYPVSHQSDATLRTHNLSFDSSRIFYPDPAFDIYADPNVEKILSILHDPQQIHRPADTSLVLLLE